MTPMEIMRFAHSIGFRSLDQLGHSQGMGGSDYLNVSDIEFVLEGDSWFEVRGCSVMQLDNNTLKTNPWNMGTWSTPDEACLALAKLNLLLGGAT